MLLQELELQGDCVSFGIRRVFCRGQMVAALLQCLPAGEKKAVIMKIIQSEMRVKKPEMPLRYLSYPRESITILTSLTSGICACMDSVW